jgi:hypothetical protein
MNNAKHTFKLFYHTLYAFNLTGNQRKSKEISIVFSIQSFIKWLVFNLEQCTPIDKDYPMDNIHTLTLIIFDISCMSIKPS